jgi:hypothetical protein
MKRAMIRNRENRISPANRLALLVFMLCLGGCSTPDTSEGWVELFNGRDLSGWRENRFAHDPHWEVQDGILIGNGGQGYLATNREFTDFELVAVVRISDTGDARGNSGIYIRCQPHENRDAEYPPGYEVQCDHLDENNPTGSIYNLGVPGSRAPLPRVKDGEWFTLRVLAQGNHLQTWVNGEPAVDCYDPQNRYPKGYVLLQMHHRTGIVEFQQVRLRPIPVSDPAP